MSESSSQATNQVFPRIENYINSNEGLYDLQKLSIDPRPWEGSFSNIHKIAKNVFKAEFEKETIAIKIYLIPKQKDEKQECLKRIDREISTLNAASSNSVHVVKFLGICLRTNEILIFMEYVDISLQDFINAKKFGNIPYDEKEACAIFSQIIEGLYHCQSLNILHRDLKPSNVLLSKKNGVVKISDFGEAKKVEDVNEVTEHTADIGTMLFCAPEQVENKNYGFKAIIWSFGITLYYFIRLEMPFKTKNPRWKKSELLKQMQELKNNYMPIYHKNMDEVTALLIRCIEYRQENRPALDVLTNFVFYSTLNKEEMKRLTMESILVVDPYLSAVMNEHEQVTDTGYVTSSSRSEIRNLNMNSSETSSSEDELEIQNQIADEILAQNRMVDQLADIVEATHITDNEARARNHNFE